MFGRRPSPGDLEIGTCPFGEQAMSTLPKGHKPVEGQSQEQCPFQKMQQQQAGEADKPAKKQKKPRGGCPMMPSETKRNPPLGPMKEYYDTQFVSIFGYMLDQRGIWALTFDNKELNKGPIKERRKVFDTYPIYLKHTIFQDEPNTKKMRSVEVAQRFFVFDKFREQGNKRMNKGEYDEAIKYYERALGCYKWLEYVEEPDSDEETKKAEEKPKEDVEAEINESPEETEKLLTEEEEKIKEEIDQYKQEQKQFRKQYRSLMKVYTDETVKLHDPTVDLPEESDKELVQSMLFSLYMNMAICYMSMSHFTLARAVLEDASKINENNSQLMYRKSQAISYDKWSNYKQLLKAKEFIEKGIEMSNYEKIFKQEPGILRLMNLTNAKEMYVEQAHYCMERLKSKKEWVVERVRALFERAKEIEEIEKEMIEDGKTPFEDGVSNVQDEEDCEGLSADEARVQEEPKQRLYRLCGPQLGQEHQEFEIVQEMVRKYYRIIEFYTEQKKVEQINVAKRELQRMMETVNEMYFYLNLDFIDYENDDILRDLQKEYEIDLKSKKIIRRLCHLCRDKLSDIFGKGIFNFEVMDYAMKDYFKRKNEEEKQARQETEVVDPPKKSWFRQHVLSLEFSLSMLLFAIVAGTFYYINGRTSVLSRIFGKA